MFKGENVHISELQTTNVTASPVLREYNTRPQTHTREMIRWRSNHLVTDELQRTQDVAMSGLSFSLLSWRLDMSRPHTNTHRHLISAKHHGSISWIICRVGNPRMHCGEFRIMMLDFETKALLDYIVYIVTRPKS